MDPVNADHEFLLHHSAVEAAPRLLGAILRHESPDGPVAVRLTEVEAYLGAHDSPNPDPGSHGYKGRTERNAVMFGPAGYMYVYFTYGMHFCANIVCGTAGTSTGVLMRAGEIVEGKDLAYTRRPAAKNEQELAKGPARLTQALGIDRQHNGIEVFRSPVTLQLADHPPSPQHLSTGPRVGVSGPGGGHEYPWRFWLSGNKTVSVYRAAKPRQPPVV
ncbi:DNA-3-methyladenine glycosylase [Arthrobacter pigmenti]